MTHNAKLKLVILLLSVVIAIPLGCSEKVVNEPAPDFGDANIVIEIERSPEAPEILNGVYRLTVTAPDMDTLIADLTVVGGLYVVGAIQVPFGDRRRFVLEFIDNPESESPTVYYRGEAVSDVRPVSVVLLDIVLRPVAPIAKLWPGQTYELPGGDFGLDLKLYNLPAISMFAIAIEWDDQFLRLTEAIPNPSLGENVAFVEFHPNESNSPIFMMIADTLGASIVDARGNASLVHLDFTSPVMAGDLLTSFSIHVTSAQAVGVGGEVDSLVSGRDFFVEDARVTFATIPDVEVSFPDAELDRVIRGHQGVPTTGTIMLRHVLPITYLSVGDLPVSDLDGIQYLFNLRTLNVSWTGIGDLNMLYAADLIGLQSMYAESCNLTTLLPMMALTNLSYLDVDDNTISNIEVVAAMSKMSWLEASSNQISDLSPLQELPEIYRLYLHDNLITDITPLVNNPGIGSGDYISIYGNPVNISNDPDQVANIEALEERGVTVVRGVK